VIVLATVICFARTHSLNLTRCHSCSFWFKVRRQHSLQV